MAKHNVQYKVLDTQDSSSCNMCEEGNHGGFSTLVLFDMMLFSQTAPLRNSRALLRSVDSFAAVEAHSSAGCCAMLQRVCNCFLLLLDVSYCFKRR
jgi:hypothetical protein